MSVKHQSGVPEAQTLPARYYVDPAYFRQEREHLFGSLWVAAGRAEQVPNRGDYLLREVAGESLILVRSDADSIRAFSNVCRHRGTRICTAAGGTFAETIQCPYHAWSYDLAGRLVGAPHMEDVPRFRKDDYPLHEAAVAVWDGHLFLNLAPAPKPLESQLGDLPAKFGPWGMADLRLGARITYEVAANWKLIVENFSECLHCPLIHPRLQKLSHYLSGVNEPPCSAALGGWMVLRDGVETLSLDGRTPRASLPALDLEQQRRVYYYAVLPNLLLSLHPDYMMTHTLWPRACDRTEIICEWHFHPDELARPGFDPSDAVGFWDMTNRQDWHVCELSQLGLSSRAYAPGPYSDREGLLYEFDRLILQAEKQFTTKAPGAERQGGRDAEGRTHHKGTKTQRKKAEGRTHHKGTKDTKR
jgi:Rieske 2Fe-2S family protein